MNEELKFFVKIQKKKFGGGGGGGGGGRGWVGWVRVDVDKELKFCEIQRGGGVRSGRGEGVAWWQGWG